MKIAQATGWINQREDKVERAKRFFSMVESKKREERAEISKNDEV